MRTLSHSHLLPIVMHVWTQIPAGLRFMSRRLLNVTSSQNELMGMYITSRALQKYNPHGVFLSKASFVSVHLGIKFI